MSTVVIMPGGFHPFHAGHMALYNSAREAFPGAEVYVAASNDTKTRPFPFALKEKLAKVAGVQPGHFVQVKSPFQPKEITQNYDPEKDVLIFVRSQKDMKESPIPGGVKKNGEPAYFQPFKRGELEPFGKHAYMAYLPTVEFGPGITSATEIRNAWPNLNDKQKTAMVMSLYPATQKNLKLAQNVVQMLDVGMGGEQNVAEGWFFKSPEEKEKKRLEKEKRIQQIEQEDEQRARETLNKVLTSALPNLIETITYNQFESAGPEWFGIRGAVFTTLSILDDSVKQELKRVSDLITAKLKLFGSVPDLMTLDNEKNYLLKFNQRMLIDKDYILKLLNEYANLIKTGLPKSSKSTSTVDLNNPANQGNKNNTPVISKEPSKNVNPELQKRLAARKAGNPTYGGLGENINESLDYLDEK